MKKEINVDIPMVPNFITVGGQSLSVADFTELELRRIGREWTIKLIQHAAARRRQQLLSQKTEKWRRE